MNLYIHVKIIYLYAHVRIFIDDFCECACKLQLQAFRYVFDCIAASKSGILIRISRSKDPERLSPLCI